MAHAIHVPGAVQIQVSTGSGTPGAMEILGYTINGADITHDVLMSDVPGDQNGGDEGPPIDIQYFGQTARVRLELSSWDKLVASVLLSRFQGGDYQNAATTHTVGTLLSANSKGFRLHLKAETLGVDAPLTGSINFLFAVPRSPVEFNKGTKFARLMFEFECHQSDGILFNEDVSGLATHA